jgi:pimeloyl-ACP methyl ester carboxylesterase
MFQMSGIGPMFGQVGFFHKFAGRQLTLIVWGPQDGYMPEMSASAYRRDLPGDELHLLDGGHWLLETNLAEVVRLSRDFLGRVHA